jgi:hypothetical protein
MEKLYGRRNFIKTSAIAGIGLGIQEVLFHLLVKDFLRQREKS